METTYYRIYKLYFEGDSRIYVGKTLKPLSKRRNGHIQQIKSKNHSNYLLADAMMKFGQDAMKIELLELCNYDESKEREIFWIKKLNATDNKRGFNLSIISNGGANFKLSELQKEKISIAKKGIKFSEEHKQRLRMANLGKRMSEEDKQKRKDWYKSIGGFTLEQRLKMSKAASYKRNDDTKAKMATSREEKIASSKGMTLEEWRNYKLNAVRYWIENSESSSVVAKKFKVDKSMLYTWKSQYESQIKLEK
jgi:hypothetical protein